MKVFYSMLKACIFGAAIALASIFVYTENTNYPKKDINMNMNLAAIEEGDQDPSFVSRFSRAFIYSSDSGKEMIESVKSSLPVRVDSKVSAKAYVVIDLERKVVVLEKDQDKVLPIASITKLITAVVAKKLIDQNDSVTITKQILNTYGNEAWLREGEKFKVEDLFYPLLMVSSNDAAEALSLSYFRGRQQFIKEMNNWVNSIGAYQTYFADPSGLSYRNVSTAKDLSIIIQWILKNEPEIFDITLLKVKTIKTHTWINPTHFLNLESFAGGKNGYTQEANRTSAALFKLGKQQRLYGVILLGSSSRDTDVLDLLEEAVR